MEHVFGGQGKTNYLLHKALADIEQGAGVLFVDPVGSATDALLSRIPKHRTQDCLVIDPTDVDHPVGWNVLHNAENKPLLAAILSQTIKAIWNYDRVATPVLDRMTYNTIAALLEYPDATLLMMEPMLTDRAFRDRVLEHVRDPVLCEKWSYWSGLKDKDWQQLISSTENKAGEFSEDPRIRNIMGQRSTFDLKRMMFDRKIVLLRLPQGQLGNKTAMFGSLFLAHVQAIAYSRSVPIPFGIYIDDAYHFDTPVLRQLVSAGRRYGLSVTAANQYLAQLSPELRSSLIGNADRRVMFRTGIEDSDSLHRTIPENNTLPKMHELPLYEAMVFDGDLRRERVPLFTPGRHKRVRKVVEQSRRVYSSKRKAVEQHIASSLGGLHAGEH